MIALQPAIGLWVPVSGSDGLNVPGNAPLAPATVLTLVF